MKTTTRWLATTTIAAALAAALPTTAARADEPSLPDLVERVAPAVVNIHTAGVRQEGWLFGSPFGTRQWTSLGSGFVVDGDGHVVTNHHVIADASTIRVGWMDGTIRDATVVGFDPASDLALLSVDAHGLAAVELAPAGAGRVGEDVFAVGNPYGYDHTVTRGIISALYRDLRIGPYDDFLQTDASINPGNSGGPLFDMQGRVVGVNTVIHAGGEGLGFAVPVEMLRAVLPQLERGGDVRRGWTGLRLDEDDAGLVVAHVFEGSPAADGDLRAGDRPVAVAGRPVRTREAWIRALGRSFPGDEVTVTLERGEKRRDVSLTLVDHDAWAEQHAGPPLDVPALGIAVRLPTPDVALQAGLDEGTGLEVVEVYGALGPRLFRVGDVLLELNGVRLDDPMDLPPVADDAIDARQVSSVVVRDGGVRRQFIRW